MPSTTRVRPHSLPELVTVSCRELWQVLTKLVVSRVETVQVPSSEHHAIKRNILTGSATSPKLKHVPIVATSAVLLGAWPKRSSVTDMKRFKRVEEFSRHLLNNPVVASVPNAVLVVLLPTLLRILYGLSHIGTVSSLEFVNEPIRRTTTSGA